MKSEIDIPAPQAARRRPLATAGVVLKFVRRKPLGGIGLGIVVIAGFMALFGSFIAPLDPWATRLNERLQDPSVSHWFGTDHLGRDVFSRALHGARVSIYVGVTTTIMATLIGLFFGVSCAYFGGKYDLAVQRVVDGLAAIPTLLLALALVTALNVGMQNVIIALTIVSWPRITRVVRSAALSSMATPYVDAARTLGANHMRVMFRHVAPNVFAPLIIVASATVGAIITAESTLSFLGLGVPYKTLSWGGLLGGDTRRYFAAAPWMVIGPGGMLAMVVFGTAVFADALRDVLDPRLRGR